MAPNYIKTVVVTNFGIAGLRNVKKVLEITLYFQHTLKIKNENNVILKGPLMEFDFVLLICIYSVDQYLLPLRTFLSLLL